MSRYTYPIAHVENNELVSIKGDKSFFYKIDSIDLEQLNNQEVEGLFSRVAAALNHLDEDTYLKFYKIADKSFLNTNTADLDLGVKLKAFDKGVSEFFKDSDIYSDIGIYDDYILFNGKYRRVISIKSISEEESYPLFLPHGFDYVLNIKKLSNDKALKELEHVRRAHSVSLIKEKRDFQSEGAYDQAEDLIHALTHGQECLFNMELYFIIEELSLEDLNTRTKDLLSILKLKGMSGFIEGHSFRELKSGLFDIYKELIPGVKPSFKHRNLLNKTNHLKHMIPLHKSKLMEEGIRFFDTNSKEIFFNPFDSSFKNKNMLVTGESGGGKSVFVNKLVHSLMPKHPCVILDKGGSFKKLCLYHNGYNLSTSLNPMDFKCPYYLREFILSVVDMDRFKKLEKGLLLKKIKSLVEQNQDLEFFSLITFLEEDFKGLSLYFEDIKDFISNEKTDLKNFLYVDIENYPKTLVAPLIIYVLEYFKNIDESQKILVFDECWSFLKDHANYVSLRLACVKIS